MRVRDDSFRTGDLCSTATSRMETGPASLHIFMQPRRHEFPFISCVLSRVTCLTSTPQGSHPLLASPANAFTLKPTTAEIIQHVDVVQHMVKVVLQSGASRA